MFGMDVHQSIGRPVNNDNLQVPSHVKEVPVGLPPSTSKKRQSVKINAAFNQDKEEKKENANEQAA